MFVRSAAAALAVLGLWTASAPAQDLGGKVLRLVDVPVETDDDDVRVVGDDDDHDTILVRGYRGGWGGYRGGFVGYRGGFNRGFYGGFNRGFYGRSFVGVGFRSGFAFRSYCAPRFVGCYRPSFCYSTPIFYSSPSFCAPSFCSPSFSYFPCSSTGSFSVTLGSYSTPRQVVPFTPMPGADQPPPIPREEDTFPYNGDPQRPVPMPGAEQPEPQRAVPVDPTKGRIVSLPARSTKFAYPAYGEKVAPSTFASDRPTLVKDDTIKTVKR